MWSVCFFAMFFQYFNNCAPHSTVRILYRSRCELCLSRSCRPSRSWSYSFILWLFLFIPHGPKSQTLHPHLYQNYKIQVIITFRWRILSTSIFWLQFEIAFWTLPQLSMVYARRSPLMFVKIPFIHFNSSHS